MFNAIPAHFTSTIAIYCKAFKNGGTGGTQNVNDKGQNFAAGSATPPGFPPTSGSPAAVGHHHLTQNIVTAGNTIILDGGLVEQPKAAAAAAVVVGGVERAKTTSQRQKKSRGAKATGFINRTSTTDEFAATAEEAAKEDAANSRLMARYNIERRDLSI